MRLGTRGSELARRQAELVAAALRQRWPAIQLDVVVIRTEGDTTNVAGRFTEHPGLFTTALTDALRQRRIDLAVHSLKDLPTLIGQGTVLGAILMREDPADALVAREGHTWQSLPPGATVGTSSLRRRALVLAHRPDLRPVEIRGNVPNRVKAVDDGAYDAVVLARAGLARLGLEARVSHEFSVSDWPPAPGQGALAIEIRHDDPRASALVRPLDVMATRLATSAERTFMHTLGAGCHAPVGAVGQWTAPDGLSLLGMVAAASDGRLVFARETAEVRSVNDAQTLGLRLASRVLAQARPAVSGV